MKILDIGCAKNKVKGAVGLDYDKNSDADIFHDVNKPFPIESDSFDLIYCKHLLEHVDNPVNVIKEIYKVGRHGARIIIEVPHFSSHIAYSNLTHKRYFSFVLLNNLVSLISHKTLKKEITFYKTFRLTGISFFANKFKEGYERFWTYIFPVENLKFEIEIVKSEV